MMEAADKEALAGAVSDAREGGPTLPYVRRAASAEAVLFAFLVTRAVVGLATAPDAEAAVSAAIAKRGAKPRGRARAAFALVLPAHASRRDNALWPQSEDSGKSAWREEVSRNLVESVRATLSAVCAATTTSDLADLPARLDDMWGHVKLHAPRLSVTELRLAIDSWALSGADSQSDADGDVDDASPAQKALPPRTPPASTSKKRRAPRRLKKPASQPESPRRGSKKQRAATLDELQEAYAAAFVSDLPECGCTIEHRGVPTAFWLAEFLAARHVLAVLGAPPWQRLAKAATGADDVVHVALDSDIRADVDLLLREVLGDSGRSKHEWTDIFNGVGGDSGRCTVEFRGDTGQVAESVCAKVRRAVLAGAFGADDGPLRVVEPGALWLAPGAGEQEPHLDVVPVKVAAHLAECGLLPYAVFVTGAEPRTLWLLPSDRPGYRATIPPYTAALLPATMLHHGDRNDGSEAIARLFFFLAASQAYIKDADGETSTFRRSENALPNNWLLVDGLHAAHGLRHRAKEVRRAVAALRVRSSTAQCD